MPDDYRLIQNREPPHNLEAEQALLGAILVNARAYEKVSEFLRPEHFADPPKTLEAVTHRVRQIELQRLLSLCVDKSLWACEEAEKYAHLMI